MRKQFVVTPPDDISGPMVAGLPTFLRLRFDWQLFGSVIGEPPLAYRQARAKQVGSTDVGS